MIFLLLHLLPTRGRRRARPREREPRRDRTTGAHRHERGARHLSTSFSTAAAVSFLD